MSLMHGVQPSEIVMTPDRTVVWQRHEIPSLDGSIYLAPTCPPDAATTLLSYKYDPGQLTSCEYVKSGVQAVVARAGDLAVRIARWTDELGTFDESVGLSALRSNVMLETGMRRIDATLRTPVLRRQFKVTTPNMYACFIPVRLDESVVSVMSFEEGVDAKFSNRVIPGAYRRRLLYEKATASCGGRMDDVWYDDGEALLSPPQNLILKDDDRTLVKFDVFARKSFRW